MKKYQSKKGYIIPFLIVLITLFLTWSHFGFVEKQKEYWFLIVLSVISLVICLWVFFQSYYILTDKELKYRCGPISGEIEISRINTILKGETFYWGIKYGLSIDGMIIKYGKYDDVFISPKFEDIFIEEILKINPHIRIQKK